MMEANDIWSAGLQYGKSGNYQEAAECFKMSASMYQVKGDQEGVANSYFGLGECYQYLHMHAEAVSSYKKCLPIFANLVDKTNEGQVCSSLGYSYFILNQYKDSREFLHRGLNTAKQAGDRETECGCLLYLSDIYGRLGQYNDYLKYAKSSLDIAEEINYAEGMASACYRVGAAYNSVGQTHGAIEYNERALQWSKQTKHQKTEADAYHNLAMCYSSSQDYQKAKQYAEKSLDIAKEKGDLMAEGEAYREIGNALSNQGKDKEAIECYYLKYLKLAEEADDQYQQGLANMCLGNASKRIGKHYDAIRYYKRCIELKSLLGIQYGISAGHENLATVYRSLGKFEEARNIHEEFLQASIKAGDVDGQKTAYINLIDVYLLLGKGNLARESRLMFIILAVRTLDKRGHILYYQELGDCFFKQNNLHEAMVSYNKAIQLALQINDSKILQSIYSSVAEISSRLKKYHESAKFFKMVLTIATDDKEIEAHTRHKLGIVQMKLAVQNIECQQHEKYLQSIQLSERYLRESLHCWEELYGDLREKHEYKISIVDTYVHAYKALALVLIETNRAEEALVACERGRACALGDSLVSMYRMQQRVLPNNFQEETLDKSRYINHLSTKSCLLFYSFTLNNIALHFWVHSQQQSLIYRQTDIQQNSTAKDSNASIIQYVTKLVSSAYQSMDVRQMAENCEDRSLENREHDDDRDENQTNSVQSIARSRAILEQDLIDSEYLNLRHFRNFETSDPEESDDCKEPLKELFKELITPVQQHLIEEEIVIVPEGPLYLVPFAVLIDPQSPGGSFLCETKRIRLVPSLTTIQLLKDCPADYHCTTGALVVGNPRVGEVLLQGKTTTFDNLPAAGREAEAIGAVLGVEPLTGIHATKDAVKGKLQEGVAVIHIAAHGDSDNGQIALAPGVSAKSKGIAEEEDYILTMQEVQEIGVRAQLVVLSCCHSGRGKIRAEGVVGMSRAFLVAGARAVVASLWAVEDQATFEFMSRFYMYLRRGDSASISLNKTMNNMKSKQDKRYNAPKYWAPFFLIGDDVTIF